MRLKFTLIDALSVKVSVTTQPAAQDLTGRTFACGVKDKVISRKGARRNGCVHFAKMLGERILITLREMQVARKTFKERKLKLVKFYCEPKAILFRAIRSSHVCI